MKNRRTPVKNLKEAIRLIKLNFSELEKQKVKHISVFGSFARNEQTGRSDIDLLVEFSQPIGYFEYFDVKMFLEGLLRRKVDLVLKESIRKEFKDSVEKELILAAEKRRDSIKRHSKRNSTN